MRSRPALAAALAGALALAGAAAADRPAQPLAPAPGGALLAGDVFADVPTGARLVFSYQRAAEPADPRLPEIEGSAEILIAEAKDGGREAVLTMSSADETRTTPPFPAAAVHPLLLVFLENGVRTMAAVTGGNPEYIRSRFRSSLWLPAEREAAPIAVAGAEVEAERLTYRPFAQDPHRDQMGSYADLVLSFVVSPAVPGRIAVLEARTEAHGDLPGLVETMTYERLEAGGDG